METMVGIDSSSVHVVPAPLKLEFTGICRNTFPVSAEH